jgi:hypothetical protein
MRIIERLKQRLGDLSPNGKMLADLSLRTHIRRLYDDGVRQRLTPISTTFGDNPAPRSALERLDQTEKTIDPIDFINSEFASSSFLIFCDSCDIPPYLAFSERAKAEAIIADVGRKCIACGKRKLSVHETFSIREPYVRGLQQGLWLESLASDVLTSRTEAAWTGQMVELNEIDVLGVFMEHTILIECKDTSFGKNDLYITAIKAQQVDADLVIIISTNDVHPNVREGVTKIGGRRERREFEIIADQSAEVIKDKLTAILNALSQGYISRWIEGDAFSSNQIEVHYLDTIDAASGMFHE